MPTADKIATFYPENYYSFAETANSVFSRLKRRLLTAMYGRGSGSALDRFLCRIGRLFLLGLPQGYYGTKTFLDVGCGRGTEMELMESLGWAVEGFEVTPQVSEQSTKIKVAALFDHELFDQTFDFIRIWHVIEHIPDPHSFLNEVVQLLSPGAQVVFGFPNTHSVYARLFGRYWYNRDIPRHVINYDVRCFPQVLAKHGLKTRGIHYRTCGALLGSLEHLLAGAHIRINLINRAWLVALFLPLDMLTDLFRLGDCVVVVALLDS